MPLVTTLKVIAPAGWFSHVVAVVTVTSAAVLGIDTSEATAQ
jgi:hypothetical protein